MIDFILQPCNTTTHKARKRHRCCECGGWVQPRESYRRVKGHGDGEWWDYKFCVECWTLRTEINEYDLAFTELGEYCCDAGGELRERFIAIQAKRRTDP